MDSNVGLQCVVITDDSGSLTLCCLWQLLVSLSAVLVLIVAGLTAGVLAGISVVIIVLAIVVYWPTPRQRRE